MGPKNRTLHQHVDANWNSNETWKELAMLYRLDEYVGWLPKTLRSGNIDDDVKKKAELSRDKFWADIWEAWWACCFWERELWGDDIEDLLSCLRRIMELKYRGLVQGFSTRRIMDGPSNKNTDRRSTMSVVDVRSEQGIVDVKEIRRGDDAICEWLGTALPGKEKDFLGYLANLNEELGGPISIFAFDKDVAVSTALAYAKFGYKSITLSHPPFTLFSKLTFRKALQKDMSQLIHHFPVQNGNRIRQKSFNFLIETCFGNPQPLSISLHIEPLLHRIQLLRRETIRIGTCPANHLARIFWFEVQSIITTFFKTFVIESLGQPRTTNCRAFDRGKCLSICCLVLYHKLCSCPECRTTTNKSTLIGTMYITQ